MSKFWELKAAVVGNQCRENAEKGNVLYKEAFRTAIAVDVIESLLVKTLWAVGSLSFAKAGDSRAWQSKCVSHAELACPSMNSEIQPRRCLISNL